ncbi:MAG: tRNA (pseudouridine(54)-N(1))-methyltransferase [Candidatus Heimdallarchaeota archaeon LC_2]|nr:MAG: tRNA (pseudouridine(54)-N(1))-methyltransferase [Candidatus Heimdallarchaeota archaeon LC_2]
MQFLVISQRAIPIPNYSLKDLTGHGRIDIIMRCVLASCRPISKIKNEKNTIYCYLKGSMNPKDWGWIKWDEEIIDEDEISIAGIIKEKWDDVFTIGSLNQLIESINTDNLIYLHEEGQDFKNMKNKISHNSLIILGAQSDLIKSDLLEISQSVKVKLSIESMLASQVITFIRQKVLLLENQ